MQVTVIMSREPDEESVLKYQLRFPETLHTPRLYGQSSVPDHSGGK